MKRRFIIIGLIGIIIICILSFIIPKDPYEMVPSFTYLSFDKPLWLCITLSGSFIYMSLLYELYMFKTKH